MVAPLQPSWFEAVFFKPSFGHTVEANPSDVSVLAPCGM